jgi:phosphoribosylformylglycinamidine cyclo-ligase
VGSKVLLAIKARQLTTIGTDLVAMSVNDLLTCGAEPLFFLDYVAVARNVPERTAQIVKGVARGCRDAGCALLGGETAEMPDIYGPGQFDLAGFAVGVVERRNLITGERVRPGDVIVGLASTGLHSNGYTLARKLFFEQHRYTPSSRIPGVRSPLGAALLKPTRIYAKTLLPCLGKHPRLIRGMAHITGGGLPGNLRRVLPPGCRAIVEKGSWKVPAIFGAMQSLGVAEPEMYRVFNMGIGMAVITRRRDARALIRHCEDHKTPAYPIGTITTGRRAVRITE